MGTSHRPGRTPPLHHRGQRGRRQEHPHRPPALRFQRSLRRPVGLRAQSHPQPVTGGLDLSLLTDGLRAEREQGITIDVAYRYFATSRRKFIIADTPGHEQYTRNMATGASTANLAIVLIDARHGVLPQSRRHTHIAALLAIPHIVVAVNKMDLVDFREEVFDAIRREFTAFAAQLEIRDVLFIPISALMATTWSRPAPRTPWYDGPSLLEHLENRAHRPRCATWPRCAFPCNT